MRQFRHVDKVGQSARVNRTRTRPVEAVGQAGQMHANGAINYNTLRSQLNVNSLFSM